MNFPIYSFIQTNPSIPDLKSPIACLSTQYLTKFVTNFSVILWKGGKSWLNLWADSWTFTRSKNISHIKTIVWNIWKHWTYLLLNWFSFSFWWQWRWQKYTLPECFLVYFDFGSLPSYFGRYHIKWEKKFLENVAVGMRILVLLVVNSLFWFLFFCFKISIKPLYILFDLYRVQRRKTTWSMHFWRNNRV